MNAYNKLLYLAFLLLLSMFTLGTFYIYNNVPVFGDGVHHISKAKQIYQTGKITYNDPIRLPLFEGSKQPKYLMPALFHTVAAIHSSITVDTETSVEFLNYISILLLAFFLYEIIKMHSNIQTATLSILFLFSLPMIYWILSHRLIEPFLFMLIAGIFYILLKYPQPPLLAILATTIIMTKHPGPFSILAVIIYLVIKRELKKLTLFFTLLTVLIIPFILFNYSELGIPYPSPDSFFQKHLPSLVQDIEYNSTSKFDQLGIDLVPVPEQPDRLINTLPWMYKEIKEKNIPGVLQFFAPIRISDLNTSSHWFGGSPQQELFLIIFISGLLLIVAKSFPHETKQPTIRNYCLLLISLSIPFVMVYYNFITISRYFFFVNIFFILPLVVPIIYLSTSTQHILTKTAILTIVVVGLVPYYSAALRDSLNYYYSFEHNPLYEKKYSGYEDIIQMKQDIELEDTNCLFTPTREPSYHLNIPTKWDSRLTRLKNPSDFDKIFPLYKCKLILIPFYCNKCNIFKENATLLKSYNTFSIFRYE